MTIGAGSGGVRASRFAAQYYNAKVAVVELPFGFVSSDDVGGAYLGWFVGWKWPLHACTVTDRQMHQPGQLGRSGGSHTHRPQKAVARVGCCMLLLGRRCWRHMRDTWVCPQEAAGVWSYVQ